MNNPFGQNLADSIDSPPIVINIPKSEETQTINDDIRNDVYNNIIYKYIKSECKELIATAKRWKYYSLMFTLLKYICLVSVPVLSLSSPYFSQYGDLFAYLSGALSSAGLGFERVAKLAINIEKSKEEKVNILLKQIGIDNFELKDVDIISNNDKFELTTPKKIKR